MSERYGKDYNVMVGKKLKEIIKAKGLKQKDVVELCDKAGFSITQGTLSNIQTGKTATNINSLAGICRGLGISMSDFFREVEGEGTCKIQGGKGENDIQTDLAYKGYLGDYHVYFFPTISGKHDLLHGLLNISPIPGQCVCKASMKLFTGDKKNVNGVSEEIVKEYEGEFVISIPMQSGYCILRNTRINEQCFFVFHHWHIINNELLCRMAAAVTTSAGGNRRPTVHRLYMGRDELSKENQKYIRGQLRLNDSDILISKGNYTKLLSEENIPDNFKEIFEEEAKLEMYYSVMESKLVNCNIPDKEFAQAVSLLRDYSVAAKYNKVSMKTDEFIFDYYPCK